MVMFDQPARSLDEEGRWSCFCFWRLRHGFSSTGISMKKRKKIKGLRLARLRLLLERLLR